MALASLHFVRRIAVESVIERTSREYFNARRDEAGKAGIPKGSRRWSVKLFLLGSAFKRFRGCIGTSSLWRSSELAGQ